jgi:DNA-binding NarL/FixJ family response regulator
MEEKIKIIIADDHPIFRIGLKQIIENVPDYQITGEASDGQAVVELILKDNPDIAVLDIDMPNKNGLEVLRELSDKKLKTKFIILSLYNEKDMFNEAMDLGIMGYILKESVINEIIDCIRAVMQNKYYISSNISDLLVNRSLRARDFHRQNPSIDELTTTEKKILRLIAEKKTSKEIGEELHLSHRTIDNHRTNISNKLNLHGTHSLVKFAIENKSRL